MSMLTVGTKKSLQPGVFGTASGTLSPERLYYNTGDKLAAQGQERLPAACFAQPLLLLDLVRMVCGYPAGLILGVFQTAACSVALVSSSVTLASVSGFPTVGSASNITVISLLVWVRFKASCKALLLACRYWR